MDDTQNLSEELENLHDEAFSWAMSVTRFDRDEAMDVLHDTYIKILDGRATFSGRSAFKTWVFGVIRNTARERWRRRAVRSALLLKFPPRPAPVELPDHVADQTGQKARIVAAINQLSDRQREVVDLVFYHDLTVEEAAEVMGVGVGSARTHYARAKDRLAQLLEDEREET